jgi:hypothetical protein
VGFFPLPFNLWLDAKSVVVEVSLLLGNMDPHKICHLLSLAVDIYLGKSMLV